MNFKLILINGCYIRILIIPAKSRDVISFVI